MAPQWTKYVNNFDRLMEESVIVCSKNALQFMYEALHGDGTTEPSPLIMLKANLTDNRVRTVTPFF